MWQMDGERSSAHAHNLKSPPSSASAPLLAARGRSFRAFNWSWHLYHVRWYCALNIVSVQYAAYGVPGALWANFAQLAIQPCFWEMFIWEELCSKSCWRDDFVYCDPSWVLSLRKSVHHLHCLTLSWNLIMQNMDVLSSSTSTQFLAA